MPEHDGFNHLVFGDFLAEAFDHQHRLFAAGDDQIERARLEFFLRGEDDEPAVELADADGGDRVIEGNVRHAERGARARGREHVRIVLRIAGDALPLDLHLVGEALGEEGTQRAVGEAARQDFAGGRPAFPLEEAAGKTAGCGQALAVIDGEGEEIDAGTGRPRLSGDKDDRFSQLHEHGPAGLLGDFPGCQPEGAAPDFTFNSDFHKYFPR